MQCVVSVDISHSVELLVDILYCQTGNVRDVSAAIVCVPDICKKPGECGQMRPLPGRSQ